MTFEAGRFTLAYVAWQEGMVEPELHYVTSWDTWEEAEASFPQGRIPVGYRLTDNETGRTWSTGARYLWEDADVSP